MLTNHGPVIGLPLDPAGSDIGPYLRLTLSSGYLSLAGATTRELGVSTVPLKVSAGLGKASVGDVTLANMGGLHKMIASGAIALSNGFAKVYAAAAGKVASSGTVFIGVIFAASSGDGAEVDVLRLANEPSGSRVVGGQLTTVTAADTVVTGLALVTSVVASFETDPADANELVSAQKGDQAGAPAAGSIVIKTWKTDGTDPTPIAATTFSKKVNWIAIGT